MLVVGNVYKDEAIALAKMTEEILPSSPLPGIGPVDLSLELPEGAAPSSRIRSSDNRDLIQVLIMFGQPPFQIQMSPTLL